MDPVTYFVALAFERNADDQLVAGETRERPSAEAALSEARRMARRAAGAIAFSRTGDPATGEYRDAVVLEVFGDVPEFDLLRVN